MTEPEHPLVYRDFDLLFSGSAESYQVRVLASSEGEASGALALQLDSQEFEPLLDGAERAVDSLVAQRAGRVPSDGGTTLTMPKCAR